MQTERLESMSPEGFLRLIREDDGDIIVTVGTGGQRGGVRSVGSVQFCTPGAGGGGSSRTWRALVDLMGAMAADNLDPQQQKRCGDLTDEEEQQAICNWVAETRKAQKLFRPV